MKLLNYWWSKILVVWVFVLSVLYSLLSILRHNHFESGGFDLGIYDQAVWQYAHFLYPYNTIKERMILGDHLTLTLPLLTPLFYVWDDVRILLIFQAVWISLSTFAIYKLCRIKNLSPFVSFVLSFVYSLFYGFQTLVYFDFHPVVIGVGFVPWILYFIESKKIKLLTFSILLLLLTQENMGITLAGIGLLYVFNKKERKMALLFFAVGVLWSLIALKLVAFFSLSGYEYKPSITTDIFVNSRLFFDASEKQEVWLYSLGWFSFLPLLSPGAMLAVLLDLFQYFNTGAGLMRMWSPLTHHRAMLAPFLLFGTLNAFLFLKKRKIPPAHLSLFVLFIMLFMQYKFHFPLSKLTKPIYWQNESWMQNTNEMINQIPQNTSIATQQNLIPHLSHRKEVYLLWTRNDKQFSNACGDKQCWGFVYAGKPEYILIDIHKGQPLTHFLETEDNFKMALENMEKLGVIVKEKQIGDTALYKTH